MGSKKVLETVLVLLFVTVVFWSEAESQSSDCNNVIVSLSPCLDYITGNSSSSPSSQCCNQLSNVIKAQAQCLCEVINGNSSSHGVKINQTRAFELPGACNLQTPSISRCNVTDNSPPGAPNNGSSGSGTPRTPAGGNNSSEGCRIKTMSFADDRLFSIVLILMASFLSFFPAIF
ncbi:hypothetical protein M9H77_01474 [Catharanthus roseus]|uniref:Uncharacterized protein n=1 Tax=Catharanthus roseus TaxID=4058 RepID=A0ACC0C5W8_CATRO|nr:hypothetical protein M9H77_01474 [Catharanthus roseus]